MTFSSTLLINNTLFSSSASASGWRVKEVYVVLLEKAFTSTPTLYSGTTSEFSFFLLAHHTLIAMSMFALSQ